MPVAIISAVDTLDVFAWGSGVCSRLDRGGFS